MHNYSDPIFRGCTRPAMLFGVPMLPMLVITGTFLIAGVWGGYLVSGYLSLFLLIVYVPLVLVCRQITLKDDQRLLQLFMRTRLRVRQASNKRYWGAVTFGQTTYKRRP